MSFSSFLSYQYTDYKNLIDDWEDRKQHIESKIKEADRQLDSIQ